MIFVKIHTIYIKVTSRPVITPSWPTSCRCRYVTLRFRTENIVLLSLRYTALSHKKHRVAVATLHCAFAQKTSCCCRYVTLRFRTKNIVSLPLRYTTLTHRNHLLPQAAHRTPPGSSALRESNNKAPSRNGNQPHVL